MQFSGESIVAFSDHFEKGIGVSQRVVFRRSKSDDLPQTQAGYGNPWGSLGKRSTNFVDLLLICRRISSSLVYILIYIYISSICVLNSTSTCGIFGKKLDAHTNIYVVSKLRLIAETGTGVGVDTVQLLPQNCRYVD